MIKKIFLAALIGSTLASCNNDIEPVRPSSGDLDLSNFVAIGNSLTSGYADGTLYREGQENSFPAILAQQFEAVGGGKFIQPLMVTNNGFPTIKSILGYKEDCATGVIGIAPVKYDATVNPADGTNISDRGPFNNIGIPGIRMIDYLFPGYGTMNPFASRMLTATEQAGTMMEVALASSPTFFTCWMGNNDVLGYAGSGGQGNVPGTDPDDISPLPVFKMAYDQMIDGLVASGAKGVLITIPDVVSTPAFNTIPYNGLVLNRQGQVDSLNAAYSPLGIEFRIGANPFIIADAAAPGGRRAMVEGELILLSASDSLKCGGWGSIVPIPDAYTLSIEEMDNIREATSQFNGVIREAANRYNLALFDANAYLKTIQSGIVWNGVKYEPTFVSGGIFSLDGTHLSKRGYAIVANQIIKTINAHYKSSIAEVDIHNYPGILFP